MALVCEVQLESIGGKRREFRCQTSRARGLVCILAFTFCAWLFFSVASEGGTYRRQCVCKKSGTMPAPRATRMVCQVACIRCNRNALTWARR